MRWTTVFVMVMALLAGACGGDGDGDDVGSPASSSTTEAPASSSTTAPASSTTSTTTSTSSTTTSSSTTTTVAPDPGSDPPDGVERVDYLTFAQGAVPVSVVVDGPGDGAGTSTVMQAIDGDDTPRGFVSQATDETTVTMTFELPAPTTFDRFAVPEVGEVPSPTTTFFRDITVRGAPAAGDEFVVLAEASLATHDNRGEVTELTIVESTPVQIIEVRLAGGISIETDASQLEFSELIANGEQEPAAFSEGFTGIWDALLPDIERSIGLIELKQDGVVVTGCFGLVDLTGTVSGNIARLSGVDRSSGTQSSFIFGITDAGALQGVGSYNGAPFGFIPTIDPPDGATTDCSDIPAPETPALTCGAVIHGINFDFNSANLRPDSEPVLAQLYDGLVADTAAAIVVEGHTSTEGSDEYNLDLSGRRAQAVVDDLVARGIDPARISAAGKGETEPIISPDGDEASRSINRRVEIDCG